MTVSIVLAEDSYLVREGIRMLLDEAGYDLAASVETYDELIAAVEEHQPNVVITDIRMPPSRTDEGVRAARQIRKTHPSTSVVVLSQYVEPDYALTLFEDGSDHLAYLLKERVGDLGQLEDAIAQVQRGASVVDPKVVDALVEGRTTQKASKVQRLTPRELEVLSLMATGKSNGATAEALYLSQRAVEKHINSIFTKLDLPLEPDANRRVQAVLLYLAETN